MPFSTQCCHISVFIFHESKKTAEFFSFELIFIFFIKVAVTPVDQNGNPIPEDSAYIETPDQLVIFLTMMLKLAEIYILYVLLCTFCIYIYIYIYIYIFHIFI